MQAWRRHPMASAFTLYHFVPPGFFLPESVKDEVHVSLLPANVANLKQRLRDSVTS
jgi:hypothetical protein